jgi:uncharacterized protein (TIGR03086 family)
MTAPAPDAPAWPGVGLLERAVGYTLGCLRLVTPDALCRPTPCAEWDLRMLLAHLDDGLLALTEAATDSRVRLTPEPSCATVPDPVVQVREHARQLLGAWVRAPRYPLGMPDPATAGHGGGVEIADTRLAAGLVVCAGAIEVCAHGWDVATACGAEQPIPPALATDLLDLAPLVVAGEDRPVRFAAPLAAPPGAAPGARLLAYLGRPPR